MKKYFVIISLSILSLVTTCANADIFRDATAGQSKKITAEYFGLHFHRLVLRPNEKAIVTQWPQLQVGSVRLWDSTVRWADIVPTAGQWNFERLDKYVDLAEEHHASILYTLGSTPQWASARPDEKCPYGLGCAAEPVRMAHWEEYVRQVAQRYRGRIKTYELWNEPHFSDFVRDRNKLGFYTGSVANMVEMAGIARKVLDEVDPEAKLTTPGFVSGSEHLDMFLAAGGKQYIQGVTFHFYANSAENFAKKVLEIRSGMEKNGVGVLPLWNTEAGLEVWDEEKLPPGTVRLTRNDAAAMTAQFLVLGAAVGLDRYYYYAWDNDRSGMVDRSGKHLPAYKAFAQVEKWLIGATMTGCESFNSKVVACNGSKDKRNFKIVWSDKPQTQAISVPQGLRFAGQETLMGESVPKFKVATGQVFATVSQAPTLLWFN